MWETEKDSVTSIDSVIKIFYTFIILVLEILLDFSTMRAPCLNIQCKGIFFRFIDWLNFIEAFFSVLSSERLEMNKIEQQ